MELNDQQLMEMVAAGRTELFDELAKRHRPALFRLALSKLQEQADAEDAVQEALLAAFRGRHTFDVERSFRSWLCTILLNTCCRLMRRETTATRSRAIAVHALTAASEPASNETPLSHLLVQERASFANDLLGRIPDVQADALRLRFYGELKFEEIAAVMNCSLNAAKDRVKRGLERMSQLARQSSNVEEEKDQP
jgi:RNA polymerase sigma-70 factor (ECF subfamily)